MVTTAATRECHNDMAEPASTVDAEEGRDAKGGGEERSVAGERSRPTRSAEAEAEAEAEAASPERRRARGAPLFSFGAIADVQYADKDDGWNFEREYRRYYRGGLLKLREAVDVWLRDETHSFALQLGDVIDGSNKRNGQSEEALASVKAEVDRLEASLPLGVLNSLGNHELYNFPKERWAKELNCSSLAKAASLRPVVGANFLNRVEEDEESVVLEGEEQRRQQQHQQQRRYYYSFCPDDYHRVIALDSYDVHAISEEPGPGEVREAGGGDKKPSNGVDGGAGKENDKNDEGGGGGMQMLFKHNPNGDKNDASGMDGLSKRFVQYNGGIGAEQLRWLERELADASRARQRVIGFAHVPIHPADPSAHTLLWNYEDVLEVMHKFDCVAMFLSGHRHRETYVQDEKGIHHVSLAAALEAPAGQAAFASIDVYPDCLELRGHGVVESRTLRLSALEEVSS